MENTTNEQKPYKIVLFGPESTGKTTLARKLAEYFQTAWVPEYMRLHLENKQAQPPLEISPEELKEIALGQIRLEKDKEKEAKDLLFLDTDVLQLATYGEIYHRKKDAELEKMAGENLHDLYILTSPDIPWQPDPLRDKPHERDQLLEIFEKRLRDYHLPYIKIKGEGEKRWKQLIPYLEALIQHPEIFTPYDIAILFQKNISPTEILRQLEYLKKGKLYVQLNRPATPGDGIIRLKEEEINEFLSFFEQNKKNHHLTKFVPASGAATRMFKDCHLLHHYLQKNPQASFQKAVEDLKLEKCKNKHTRFRLLAFYELWINKTKELFPDFDSLPEDLQKKYLVESLLSDEGMGYGDIPKALVWFHKYADELRTAMDEHLVEAGELTHGKIHFTIAPEKEPLFKKHLQEVKEKFPVEVSFSYQNPQTDTVMLDENDNLVRDEKGKPVFRPGGHGALIENLLHPQSDILFIKNIDNVQKDEYKHDTYKWAKILTGMLMKIQQHFHEIMKRIETQKPTGRELEEIVDQLKNTYHLTFIKGFDTLPASHKREYILFKLNRPIRVVGMVPNTGAPGGGPFWIHDDEGNISLQIVEKAQINTGDPGQMEIMNRATHFNPVFMAVSLKDKNGYFFDLKQFINPKTGFVSNKTYQGQQVRVYEHPGLWNGAMHHWLSFFVEVPINVFSPVKEFYDLMEKPHI